MDVPLSLGPGTKKFACPAVPLSRDKKRFACLPSLCPGTRAAAKIPGQTPLSQHISGQAVKILSHGKMSKYRPGPSRPVPWQAGLTARFWACPIVPLSRGTRKSRPVGNSSTYCSQVFKVYLSNLKVVHEVRQKISNSSQLSYYLRR